MSLTHAQKKFIKRYRKKLSVGEMAKETHLDEKEIVIYIKEQWGEEKITAYQSEDTTNDSDFSGYLKNFRLGEFIKVHITSFIVLFILVILAYLNAFNAEFVSDDVAGIQENPYINNLGEIFKNPFFAFRPFLYFISYSIGGLAPFAFRIQNILAHLGATFTLFILASIFFRNSKHYMGFFVAAVFAVHPILIESVTWISGGSYSQYTFCILLAFLFYILRGRSRNYYIGSCIAFILALLFSEKAAVFPGIVIAYELAFGNLKKSWKDVIGISVLCGILALPHIIAVGHRVETFQRDYQSGTFQNPFLQIPVAIVSYFILIFWPDKLTLYHSELTFNYAEFSFVVAMFIIYLVFVAYAFFKNKFLFFWSVFFIIALSPTLLPIGIAWVVAERYVYLGMIGIIFVFAYFFDKLMSQKKFQTYGYVLMGVIICGLLVRTIFRNMDWQNADNLWIATGKVSPSDPKTHNNLGDYYGRHGDLKMSEYEFRKAIALKPDYADAYHNLGNVLLMQNRIDEAIESYQMSLRINPYIWQAYQNIGYIYIQQKKYPEALEYMNKAQQFQPNDISIAYRRAFIYAEMGNTEESKKILVQILQVAPNLAEAQELLKKLNETKK